MSGYVARLSCEVNQGSFQLIISDFIHLWADVPLAETDDVAKLLAQRKFNLIVQISHQYLNNS